MKTKSIFIAPAIIALFAVSTSAQNHPRATASSIVDQSRNHGNTFVIKNSKVDPQHKPTSEYFGMPKFKVCPYPFRDHNGPIRTPNNPGNTRR